MLLRRTLLPLFFAALAFGQARQTPVIPYDSLMSDRVGVDAEIDKEEPEYPGFYVDKTAGMTVYWGFDDSLLYVALETRGRGWMAIGLGSPKMHESNMVIGYYTDESTEVVNQTGANYAHAKSPASDSAIREADIGYDEETGITTMEFVYPLKFPAAKGLAIPGLEPGDAYDVILAQNTKTISLSERHTHKDAFKVKFAEKPQVK
jgi:hypothetical protein